MHSVRNILKNIVTSLYYFAYVQTVSIFNDDDTSVA